MEYIHQNEIREALISLLSVGDTIYRIHIGRYPTSDENWVYCPGDVIRKWTVSEIVNKKRIRISSKTSSYDQKLNRVDEYKGKLYAWCKSDWISDPQKRIKKLAFLVESKETIFIYA